MTRDNNDLVRVYEQTMRELQYAIEATSKKGFFFGLSNFDREMTKRREGLIVSAKWLKEVMMQEGLMQ